MNDKISIIVPVYNAEIYLEKCLDSIIGQTYSNLEIIIINDGSTDNSSKIIENFAKKDNRIIYIERKNCGVSATRNEGLRRMSGKYYMFIDSDDTIELNCIEKMYNILKNEIVDVVRCNYKIIKNDKIIHGMKKEIISYKVEDIEKLNYHFFLDNNTMPCYSVLLLIDSKFKLLFDENIGFMEDTIYYYNLFKKIKTLYNVNDELYNYYFHETSRVNNIKNIKKNIDDIIKVNSLFKQDGILNKSQINAKHFSIILSYLARLSKLDKKEYNELYTYCKNNIYLNEMSSNCNFKNFNVGTKIKCFLYQKELKKSLYLLLKIW